MYRTRPFLEKYPCPTPPPTNAFSKNMLLYAASASWLKAAVAAKSITYLEASIPLICLTGEAVDGDAVISSTHGQLPSLKPAD